MCWGAKMNGWYNDLQLSGGGRMSLHIHIHKVSASVLKGMAHMCPRPFNNMSAPTSSVYKSTLNLSLTVETHMGCKC